MIIYYYTCSKYFIYYRSHFGSSAFSYHWFSCATNLVRDMYHTRRDISGRDEEHHQNGITSITRSVDSMISEKIQQFKEQFDRKLRCIEDSLARQVDGLIQFEDRILTQQAVALNLLESRLIAQHAGALDSLHSRIQEKDDALRVLEVRVQQQADCLHINSSSGHDQITSFMLQDQANTLEVFGRRIKDQSIYLDQLVSKLTQCEDHIQQLYRLINTNKQEHTVSLKKLEDRIVGLDDTSKKQDVNLKELEDRIVKQLADLTDTIKKQDVSLKELEDRIVKQQADLTDTSKKQDVSLKELEDRIVKQLAEDLTDTSKKQDVSLKELEDRIVKQLADFIDTSKQEQVNAIDEYIQRLDDLNWVNADQLHQFETTIKQNQENHFRMLEKYVDTFRESVNSRFTVIEPTRVSSSADQHWCEKFRALTFP